MNLEAKFTAYRSYFAQAKEAMADGDIIHARNMFIKAAETANEISLSSPNIEIKNEYHRVAKQLIEFIQENCNEEDYEDDDNSTSNNSHSSNNSHNNSNNNNKPSGGSKPNSGGKSNNKSGNSKKKDEEAPNVKVIEGKEMTIEESLAELNELIGLEDVKKTINQWVDQVKVFKKREEMGYKVANMGYHMVFTGKPGTGKTTVARIIGQIYKSLGIVSKGHLVETSREDFVGRYIGETEDKTAKIIDASLGGVLFIDEVYLLVEGGGSGSNDFGMKAIGVLLKAIEDKRSDFAVVIAGYADKMEKFMEANDGLASRFKTYIDFADYTPEEMWRIFALNCQKNDYRMSEAFSQKLMRHLEELYETRDYKFANARDVRNLFEKTISNQSSRIARNINNISGEDLITFLPEDLPL